MALEQSNADGFYPGAPKTFMAKVAARWNKRLFLCVGLDTDYQQIPAHLHDNLSLEDAVFEFNRAIIEATADLVCAFKPNLAFYEQSGPPGLVALERTCGYLRSRYPDIPVILDAKRGDIASTNQGYVASFFDYFQADAVTVQPYLGSEALAPFLSRADKGVFVLCRTSNPGARELQDLPVNGSPLYLTVAKLAASQEWNANKNVGLVAGATYPAEIAFIREVAPDLPLLIPGIGAQGGDLESVLANGLDRHGAGVIINSSRKIIYASSGPEFAEAARKEAEDFNAKAQRR